MSMQMNMFGGSVPAGSKIVVPVITDKPGVGSEPAPR